MQLPVEHLQAEFRKLGRSFIDSEESQLAWDGDELMILVTWPDGFSARVSMGPVASAMIERKVSQCTNLH